MHTLAANSLRNLTGADQIAIRIFGNRRGGSAFSSANEAIAGQVFARRSGMNVSALGLLQATALDTGFTLAGGTTSKTLTVDMTVAISEMFAFSAAQG